VQATVPSARTGGGEADLRTDGKHDEGKPFRAICRGAGDSGGFEASQGCQAAIKKMMRPRARVRAPSGPWEVTCLKAIKAKTTPGIPPCSIMPKTR
jgi:hypothetical protein